jgi:ABC-type transporter Mla maintaining outer membrane lipid asymmetry ATPase subunit MlaF
MVDELFTVPDYYTMDSVKHLIKDVVAERKIPFIVVKHRVMDSHEVGDRICIRHRDTIIEEGKPGDLCACWCRGVRTSS